MSNICLQNCESCGKPTNLETMKTDADSNWFCEPCFDELAPVMEADYQELVKKGEIDVE